MLGIRSGVIFRYDTTPNTTTANTTTKTVSGFFTLNFAIRLLLCQGLPPHIEIVIQFTIGGGRLQAFGRIIHGSVTNDDLLRGNRSVFVLFSWHELDGKDAKSPLPCGRGLFVCLCLLGERENHIRKCGSFG